MARNFENHDAVAFMLIVYNKSVKHYKVFFSLFCRLDCHVGSHLAASASRHP